MDGAFIGNHGRIELYVDISIFNTEIRHADHLAMRQDYTNEKVLFLILNRILMGLRQSLNKGYG
jgi:hypothetical protein